MLPGKTRFTDVTLVLTERCNLRCEYCYVPKRDREMPLQLALQASDWLIAQAPPGRQLSISFFGGEPLLAEPNLLAVMAHARGRRAQGLRFMAPTNGGLLEADRLARLQAAGLELALGVDEADAAPGEARGKTLATLGAAMSELRPLSPIVRMTVTPANVSRLFENVLAIFGAGLRRIMHQPAVEKPWPAEALLRWRSEHQRLRDWLAERYQARQPVPDLITLEGISQRLSGSPARPCGAGVSTAAVDAEGRLFGCYRSVFDPRADWLVLGDLRRGWMNEPLLATYAKLDPSRALPEEGSCKRCEARHGCTIYCPAIGHALLGDLRAVPALACELLRVQVEVCGETLESLRRFDQSRRRSVAARLAAATLALGLSSAACDSRAVPVQPDGAVTPDLWRRDAPAPGLCVVWRHDGAPDLTRPKPDLRPDTHLDQPKQKPELCFGGLPGSSCLVNADCCIGYCDPVLHACAPPGLCPCVPVGGYCVSHTQCCSLYCKPVLNACMPVECKTAGNSCTAAAECCSLLCLPDGTGKGVCIVPGLCPATDAAIPGDGKKPGLC